MVPLTAKVVTGGAAELTAACSEGASVWSFSESSVDLRQRLQSSISAATNALQPVW
jgi:hypothetical protein